jgi:hypothetical protein
VPQEWSKNFAAASPPLLLPHDFSSQRKRDRVYFHSELPPRCYITIIFCLRDENEQRERAEPATLLSCRREDCSQQILLLLLIDKTAATSQQRFGQRLNRLRVFYVI